MSAMPQNHRGLSRRTVLRSAAGLGALAGLGGLSACGAANAGGDKTITIIATETAPCQEPIKIAQRLLAEQGWDLKPTFVTDIVQPNLVVARGEYDANYFQHGAYLSQFSQDNDLELEPSFYTYSSPAGLWSAEYATVEDLPQGARIALPVDPANNGRGIKLLAKAGLLEIDDAKPVIHLSQQDIRSNPRGFEFVEVDQQSLATTFEDVDAGFMFVRLAGEIGLTPEDSIAFEAIEDSLPYINLVAGQPGFRESEKGTALREAIQSPEVRAWFEGYIDGALGTPWDRDVDADFDQWATDA
ncbi:MetQ/NlpA family ABC transporter substrate-binding protein [Zhihengliuella flava]|uniref:D-methionine transport system substrate-binding protein n=1 Tax=Zhihengliuella flava TaxID=1285193 RepID=A0A931D9T4_9MICC|nr:MetQ/NlpA family ABC transporter substrate-binding protein [Zhihengliuella flava]MBG6084984.1 D-methionine transport system substrate-binding protein [Zhihengliuella flava]